MAPAAFHDRTCPCHDYRATSRYAIRLPYSAPALPCSPAIYFVPGRRQVRKKTCQYLYQGQRIPVLLILISVTTPLGCTSSFAGFTATWRQLVSDMHLFFSIFIFVLMKMRINEYLCAYKYSRMPVLYNAFILCRFHFCFTPLSNIAS